MELKKNNKSANELRLKGNQHYKSSKFYDALVCYNKSLCHAIPGSEEFSLAFSNRSAVYMELGEYDLCLENIQLAIDCGHPEEKLKKLIERREKCLDFLEVLERDPRGNPWNFFKLSHPPNKKIPFVVDCIKLRESKKFGRHLITTRALKAGDIICIEEPFHKFNLNSSRFTNCANCLKSDKLNLFPCCECDYTMFCSKTCMTTADRFHHFECKTIDINPENANGIIEVAHRVVFEALGVFGKIEKLIEFFEVHAEPKSVFDFDFSKVDDLQREKNLLQVINSFQRNPIPDDMITTVDKHVELMQSITTNPNHQRFLAEFMKKQLEIIITNSFGLASEEFGVIGSGIFAFSSFFNHSCAPNITRIVVENKLAFVVTRPVEKDQQLFVCYRSNFLQTGREERRQEIMTSYRFKCVCQACTKNYPTLEELPSTDKNFTKFPSTFETTEAAKLGFKNNCDYINKNIKNFPSLEICTLMERNRLILEAIAQVASLTP